MFTTEFKTDEKSLRALEYFEIIDLLQKNASSPVGKERCRELRPNADPEKIHRSLSEIDELKRIDEQWGPIPPVDIQDTREALRKLRVAGVILEPIELTDISRNIQTCHRIKVFFAGIDRPSPCIMAIIDRLAVCKELGDEINRCIGPDGEIRDEASPRLQRVRRAIRGVRARIQDEMERLLRQEEMQPILRDRIVTQRNGRSVLLVKPEFKSHFQGIVHDYSHSRMTLFVEPISVVEMNNDLNLLLDEEGEEETRILEALTRQVREREPDLRQDLESLGELDMAQAKMKLSYRLQGVRPETNESGVTRLLGARHPLLFDRKPEETVPIDIVLDERHPVLVISGANAGGKTVALKTVGLLALMFQSGMEIPVREGSRLPVFRKILAEIGDEQSIGDDLSTFSAHLVHLREFLHEAHAESLVLVDEIGGGTNAMEGAALAMGILDHLKEQGATVVVTTHLEPLKGYGYVTPGVANAGVEFDPETLQPMYRLSYGASAPSHAFLVAEKMGIPRHLVDRARKYRQETEGPSASMIQRLEELRAEAAGERERLRKLEEDMNRRREHLDRVMKSIRERRDQILLRVEERGRALLRQTEKDLGKLVQGLSLIEPGKRKPETELREIENRLLSQVRRNRRKRSRIENLRPGEWVRVVGLGREGVVAGVHESADMAEVLVGRFKIKTSLHGLERVQGRKRSSRRTPAPLSVVTSSDDVKWEINVIGLTVEDALPLVERFIDRALVENLESVTIIHGSGSGRLREAVRSYLAGHEAVTGFGPGEPNRGGAGVTVARLGWEREAPSDAQGGDQSGWRV